MIIEEFIFRHAQVFPQKTAIIAGTAEVSYAQLWQKIEEASSYFCSCGLKRGDRVVLSASKSIEFIYSYFGAHLAGLICVPVDPETNAVRLERIVDCAKPSLIVGELHHGENYDVKAFAEIHWEKGLDTVFPKSTDYADILFTTGTTGMPKGVVLSYSNLLAAAENINTFIGNSSDDVELLALPVSHSFGLGRLRCVMLKGGTLVLLGNFASMKKFFGEMERCKATGFGMVPAGWAYLRKMSGDRIGSYARQLKHIEIGSAFMPLEEKETLMSLLPDTRICMHYGLTEASRSAFISFHDEAAHLMTAGRPSPNTEIAVFNESGERLGPEEDGEICVKGHHVCSGYWGLSEEEFRKDFNGEFFKTGDWGHLDREGYLHLVSRKKEIINVGGKKVSPIEVEETLNAISGIEESACIGVADAVLGEVVKAFCVCSREVDFEEVKKSLSDKIETYKIPVYYEVIDHLPKTSSGKLQRLSLK